LTLGMGEQPVIDVRLVESSTTSVGQVITSREVESFPTNGGTPSMWSNSPLGLCRGTLPHNVVTDLEM
jgi:hypothetical protein